ncbi:ribosomal protein L6 [Linderina pennispora]|uniref:Large ribosomal subunit protein uL6m n=1 Tax=Linderina pennispora TaxID=61395 RepID=A0A1Y1WJJ6_9FUNG|nr:ribosomal protein L6 [Linderina pennispora]ORX73396.1 ribosomal protein L6 [Linderina pennispora]
MRSVGIRVLAQPLGLGARSISTTAVIRSHIGSTPVKYTNEVQISHLQTPFSSTDARFFNKTTLTVKGPLGERKMAIEPFVSLEKALARTPSTSWWWASRTPEIKKQRAMWGTTRALIQNCVTGVTEGFSATLRLVGVGYRAAVENGKLVLRLGYSHPVEMEIPEGLKVGTPVPTRILINGTDLQQVKLYAAKIREWKKPEPYNQKGIFVNDETIRKKDGKKK